MGVQQDFYSTDGQNKTFPSTKHIATKQHMAVWLRQKLDTVEVQLDPSKYELITNAAVLNSSPSTILYDRIEIRVADSLDELTSSPSAISVVAGIAEEVVTVAGIESEVVTVADDTVALNLVADDLVKGIGTNQPTDSAILNALTNATQTQADVVLAAASANEAAASAASVNNPAQTITELLSFDTSVGYVNVLGYDTANDGGGGLFNYDSTIDKSTANGVTIIDPSVSLALQGDGVGLGCWIMQHSSVKGNIFRNDYLIGDLIGRQLLVGGVIRRYTATTELSVIDANNWFWINDSAHIPLNIDMTKGDNANTTQGGCELVDAGLNLKVYYHGKKLHTLTIAPDETMAKKGVRVGNSTGFDNAIFSFYADCEFNADLTTLVVDEYDVDLWDSVRFAVSVADNGYITVNHPSIIHTKQQAIMDYRPRNSTGSHFIAIYETSSASASNCFLLGMMEGAITNGATVSSSESIDEANYTLTWDAGTSELTVAHSELASNTGTGVQLTQNNVVGSTGLHFYITASSTTSFKVACRRVDDGTLVTTQASFDFLFNRGLTAKVEKTKIDGTLRVKTGEAQIVASQLSAEVGNFWISGITQY